MAVWLHINLLFDYYSKKTLSKKEIKREFKIDLLKEKLEECSKQELHYDEADDKVNIFIINKEKFLLEIIFRRFYEQYCSIKQLQDKIERHFKKIYKNNNTELYNVVGFIKDEFSIEKSFFINKK